MISHQALPAERLASVQIMRGVAALLVLALHLNVTLHDLEFRLGVGRIPNLAHWYQFGGIGVDLFFLISGFVMAFTMRKYEGRPSAFMGQRFLRIAPLCYVVTAAWLIMLAALGRPISLAGIVSGLTFVPLGSTYTEPSFRVLWTLSFEFAFYLLVASALLLKLKARELLLLVTVAGASGLMLILPIPLLRWVTHPILLEFSLGVAAYVIWERKLASRKILLISGIMGAAILIGENFRLPAFETNPTFAIDGTTVIPRLIYWAIPSFMMFNMLLEWRPRPGGPARAAQAIGNASYAIYLTHLFVIYSVTAWVRMSPDALWIIGFFGSVALGLAVHRWIEQPLLALASRKNNGHLFRGKPLAVPGR